MDAWDAQREVDGSVWQLACDVADLVLVGEVDVVGAVFGVISVERPAPWWCRDWLANVSTPVYLWVHAELGERLAAEYEARVEKVLGWRPKISVSLI